jgi:hypothetical protein
VLKRVSMAGDYKRVWFFSHRAGLCAVHGFVCC